MNQDRGEPLKEYGRELEHFWYFWLYSRNFNFRAVLKLMELLKVLNFSILV